VHSQLLTHTNGLASIESEEIMEYYRALGDPRGDLLVRYFMIEDEKVRAKALPEVQNWMNNLVISPAMWSTKQYVILTIPGSSAAPLRAWNRLGLWPWHRLCRAVGTKSAFDTIFVILLTLVG
jgi:hypothetical protein